MSAVTLPSIGDQLREILGEFLGIDDKTIEAGYELGAANKIDSLDKVELSMEIEDRFALPQIPDARIDEMATFADLERIVTELVTAKAPARPS